MARREDLEDSGDEESPERNLRTIADFQSRSHIVENDESTHVGEACEQKVAVRGDKVEREELDRERSVVLALVRVILKVGELCSDELPAESIREDYR